MDEATVNRDELLSRLPPLPQTDHTETLRSLIRESGRKVIVLDDDPTGTQTVHDIPVVTRWTVQHLSRELTDPAPASYVLTNSRSLPTAEAVVLNREIAEALREARTRTGRDFSLVSRSDSTLRGHFPAELDALTSGLKEQFDAWVICPFFEEGGRLTINDIHYVAEGDRLVPAAHTPFAARSGIERRPLLTPAEMATHGGSGVLVVVGSYVPKTTAQLEHLLKHSDAVPLELNVRHVLDVSTRKATVADLARRASAHLAADATVVIYTSRKLIEADADESLAIGQTISQAVVDVVRSICVRPRLLVAKGGITSSDVATKGCDVERAVVIGQALPGVPVWRCGPESRLPGLPLVVFPGNVGGVDALTELMDTWQ